MGDTELIFSVVYEDKTSDNHGKVANYTDKEISVMIIETLVVVIEG